MTCPICTAPTIDCLTVTWAESYRGNVWLSFFHGCKWNLDRKAVAVFGPRHYICEHFYTIKAGCKVTAEYSGQ